MDMHTRYERDGKTYFPGVALMLADKYTPSSETPKKAPKALNPPAGWLCSEKMDGLRALWNGECLITRSSPNKDAKMFSSAPRWFTDALPRGVALDGELWMGRGRFHEVAGISNRAVADDAAWARVRYAAFDAPAHPGGLEERLAAARAAVAERAAAWKEQGKATAKRLPRGAPKRAFPVSVVKTTRVRDAAHLAELFEAVRAKEPSGEGLIIRAPGSPYVPRRSKLMLKLKAVCDTEMRVTGRELGRGKFEGMLGALLGVETGAETGAGRVVIRVGTGFTEAERRNHARLFPDGALVSVAFMERTPEGRLRMPSFRGVREDM